MSRVNYELWSAMTVSLQNYGATTTQQRGCCTPEPSVIARVSKTPEAISYGIASLTLFARNDTLTSNSSQMVALTSPKERGEPADKSFPSPSGTCAPWGRGIGANAASRKGEGTPPPWWRKCPRRVRGIKGEGIKHPKRLLHPTGVRCPVKGVVDLGRVCLHWTNSIPPP